MNLGDKCRRRSDRRVERFQERFRLMRKSKIVKSNFFESFGVFSGLPCLFLPVLSACPCRSIWLHRRTLSPSLFLLPVSLSLSREKRLSTACPLPPSRLFLLPFYPVSRAIGRYSERPTYLIRPSAIRWDI